MGERVRIGVVGTSWWADAMYLPAVTKHPLADVRAVVGGARAEHTREFASRWSIPSAYDSLDEMLDREALDALLVLTPNKHHHRPVMAGLDHGLHILCEKPLGMSAREAREMTEAAARAGVTTMTPFTYRFMPANRYLKALVDEGYIGRPYHLNLRYYAGLRAVGPVRLALRRRRVRRGVERDLASHWGDHARWLFGEIEAVTAVFSRIVLASRDLMERHSRSARTRRCCSWSSRTRAAPSTSRRSRTSRGRSAIATRWTSTGAPARCAWTTTGSRSSESMGAGRASPRPRAADPRRVFRGRPARPGP